MQTNEENKGVEVDVPAGELNGEAGVEKETTDGDEGELDGEAEGEDDAEGEDAGEGDESDDE